MSFSVVEPVPSGRPFPVVDVGGSAPAELTQFVGDAVFTIDRDGTPSVVTGCGFTHEPGVLFQEKDEQHNGKDVRTWQISQSTNGFTASATAAF